MGEREASTTRVRGASKRAFREDALEGAGTHRAILRARHCARCHFRPTRARACGAGRGEIPPVPVRRHLFFLGCYTRTVGAAKTTTYVWANSHTRRRD